MFAKYINTSTKIVFFSVLSILRTSFEEVFVEIDGKISFKKRIDRIDSVGLVYSTTKERVSDIMLAAGCKFWKKKYFL